MAETPSTMLSLGTAAPNFTLPDARNDEMVSLSDLSGKDGLCMMFICNHCPYVVHVIDEITRLAKDYAAKGISFCAINANNLETHPQDGPEFMKTFAEEKGWAFPYLFDESQEVALAYQAACTPDFFLFDEKMELVYRGQLDNARPGNEAPANGEHLRGAMDALLSGGTISSEQRPSCGCNIKWKPENRPEY